MIDTEELARKLVEFKTTEDKPEEIRECLEFIENQFPENRFRVQQFERKGVPSLVISYGETEDPEVLLHGHIDVVGAEKQMFSPEKKNGKLFGRGTADMKSGIACMMRVMKDLEPQEPDIMLAITSDEEKGGFNGAGYLAEKEGLEPNFVISAEPDDSGNFPSIVTEQKGVLQLKVAVEGKSAHGAKPEKGENAAEKLMEKYDRIKQLFEQEGGFSTTVSLGRFEAGDSVNKVPESAKMELDIRYTDQYAPKQILEDLREIGDIEIQVMAEAPMMRTEEGNKYVRQLKESLSMAKDGPVTRRESFASDMRFFTDKGIPAVCFGPEGYGLHGKDEHVVVESMEKYQKILKRFITTIETNKE